ncbi:hypothetical protein CYMTET_29708 [Cymbomonas tetramitiformis]|uniref:Methyltransferase type 11 domain-containing protein n=1 Tax=Cymbomonas tetramitiformis TaxID=36881 RepID=A0AAE0KUW3_9CHLO|nr:hypothetical protein CYMTET_29708 [Cymbomonas tetramitiformis]
MPVTPAGTCALPNLPGDLYSGDFYSELCRILKPQGMLYHYVGDPGSKAVGSKFRGIVQRLQDAGFKGATIDYSGHGVVAAHRPINRKKKERPGNKGSVNSAGKMRRKGTKNMVIDNYDNDDDDDY